MGVQSRFDAHIDKVRSSVIDDIFSTPERRGERAWLGDCFTFDAIATGKRNVVDLRVTECNAGLAIHPDAGTVRATVMQARRHLFNAGQPSWISLVRCEKYACDATHVVSSRDRPAPAVGQSWSRMPDYFAVNVLGVENIVRAASGRRVLLASSSEVAFSNVTGPVM